MLVVAFVLLGTGMVIYFVRLPITVRASYETDPVPHASDAADDICIWIHPTDPNRSLVIGSDKDGGIATYDLQGKELQYLEHGQINNVDLRYRFPFPHGPGALVAASERGKKQILCYTIDSNKPALQEVSRIQLQIEPYGLCLYFSDRQQAYYCFVTSTDGQVEQWQLSWHEGKIVGERVRSFKLDGKSEGCVADDELGQIYISEERKAVWKLSAEPDGDSTARTMVCRVNHGGTVSPDAEGLALYCMPNGKGYLLVSSQGSNSFAVFRRDTNEFVTRFRIGDGAVDKVTGTDGIDVTSVSLPPLYPQGLFVAQDDSNDRGNQNFKLVRWDDIAKSFNPQLEIDIGWDPRQIGATKRRDME